MYVSHTFGVGNRMPTRYCLSRVVEHSAIMHRYLYLKVFCESKCSIFVFFVSDENANVGKLRKEHLHLDDMSKDAITDQRTWAPQTPINRFKSVVYIFAVASPIRAYRESNLSLFTRQKPRPMKMRESSHRGFPNPQ